MRGCNHCETVSKGEVGTGEGEPGEGTEEEGEGATCGLVGGRLGVGMCAQEDFALLLVEGFIFVRHVIAEELIE